MIVKRTRAAAGLATAFALVAVTAPSGPATLVTSSGAADTVLPDEGETPITETFSNDTIGFEPTERVSVKVPSVRAGDLAAASRTVVTRMAELEAGNISDRALGSYTFAAQAMQKADPDCQVTWSLLAAIGAIESAHGTKDGARLKVSGVAAPAIRGAALDGRAGLAEVKDTDEGRFDQDRRWDRAVGPMQLLPATWSYVGVDGDGDGKRTPDDLDDAALAVGVYLCAAADEAGAKAGEETAGLSSEEAGALGMKKALAWFNPSPAYSVLANRLEGEYLESYGVTPYSAAPGATSLQAISLVGPMKATLSPDRAVVAARVATATAKDTKTADGGAGTSVKGNGNNGNNGNGVDGSDDGAPATPITGTPATPITGAPTTPITGTPGTPAGTPTDTPSETPTETPTETPSETPAETPTETPAEPAIISLSGVLTESGGSYYLDGVLLDFTGFAGDTAALADLVDQTVTFQVVENTSPIEAESIG